MCVCVRACVRVCVYINIIGPKQLLALKCCRSIKTNILLIPRLGSPSGDWITVCSLTILYYVIDSLDRRSWSTAAHIVQPAPVVDSN